MRLRVLRVSLLILAVCSTHVAYGQKEGDKIEVNSEPVRLKVSKNEGNTVPKGTALVVKKVNGEWLWVEFEDKGGWLRREDVVPWKSPEEKRDEAIAAGNASLVSQSYGSAVVAFDRALNLDPSSPDALHGRAKAYAKRKDFASAILDYSKAITLRPEQGNLYVGRGDALKELSRDSEAFEDYKKAVKLGIKEHTFLDAFAWWLATTPYKELRDPELALSLAKEACNLTDWKEPLYFETIGAAYAAKGEFDLAIEWASKVFTSEKKLSTPTNDGIRSRIAGYKQGKPTLYRWKARNDFEKLVGPPLPIASSPPVVPNRIKP